VNALRLNPSPQAGVRFAYWRSDGRPVLELLKTARGSTAVKAVESRNVWGMWCREGTLLDPTVGGGPEAVLLFPKILDF